MNFIEPRRRFRQGIGDPKFFPETASLRVFLWELSESSPEAER